MSFRVEMFDLLIFNSGNDRTEVQSHVNFGIRVLQRQNVVTKIANA